MKKIILLLCMIGGLTRLSYAQKIIEGTVRDAATEVTLPAANIIIQGAYQGTVTNREGHYKLTISDSLLPATILVRYIGYHTQKRTITARDDRLQNFSLEPSVIAMQEITVTGKDPGLTIMEKVIRRKQLWQKKLHSYTAKAYTRQNLSSDTALVMITESVSKIYWDEEEGAREVLKWRRQTANLDMGQNFAAVSYLPNLYADNVEIAGFQIVGVTHPEALKYYNFELVDLLNIDGQGVYKIKVTPDLELQPLFEGVVYILDDAFALLKVELRPNDVVRYPPPIKDFNLLYRQQFSNYGQDIWLPIDMRIEGSLKIKMVGLEFPRMQFRQIYKISNYKINVPLPDSLYETDDVVVVDPVSVNEDSLFVRSVERVPLSKEEKRAYATLDSTQTLAKAFKPSGFLARFVDFVEDDEEHDDWQEQPDSTQTEGRSFANIDDSFSPLIRYNRVDEFFGGLSYAVYPIENLKLSAKLGYSTGYEAFSYGAGVRYSFSDSRLMPTIGFSYAAETAPRYQSRIYSPTLVSVVNLLGYPNYFDYYRREGFRTFVKIVDDETDLSMQLSFSSADHTSLQTQTGYDILGQDRIPRVNPGINAGQMNSLTLTAGYNLDTHYLFGVIGPEQLKVEVEYSAPELGSDFSFTRYNGSLAWTFETFLQRRLLPNTLSVRLSGGTFSGQLPLQELGIVDVAEGLFSPFGGLRTVRFNPYEGEQYAALHVEHNFRTIPFELLGLQPLVEQNIGLILFASAAQTWMSDAREAQIFERTGMLPHLTEGMHIEAGASINGILGIFRVDFALRLDESAFLVGIGIARYY